MFPTLRYPYHSSQLYGHSSRINPRDRYLAALAEAKAAEAELLAEEEARREEEQLAEELALRRRLEEIQASRSRHTSHLNVYDDDDFSLHRRHSYNPHVPGYASEDRLTRLRREMEEDELRAARQKKLEREREVILRKEAEIIAQKRKEEENRLELVRRRREQEEKRLLELRRAQSVQASVAPTCKRPYSSQTSHPVYITLEDLLGQFERPLTRSDAAIGHSKSTKATKTAISDVASPEDFLNLIFGVTGKPSHGTEQKSATAPVPSVSKLATVPKATPKPKATDDLANFNPEDVVKLLFGLGSQFMGAAQQEPSSTPQASSSKAGPSGSRSSSSTSTTKPVQMQQAHACNNVAAPTPKRPEPSSLKDELEARLYNDFDTEIRDTMQAILASLADAGNYEQASATTSAPAPSPASSSATSFTSKGKEKAEEPQAKAEGEATSQDVVNAMDTVNTIEAAFAALQQDFTFPSQLDFTPPSSRPSSPVSDTLSSKLAYTSRNHPLRYYEQSLSGLLAQLDGVESFGSAEVRQRRKEVVEKVEGAIEELEREVEGRWKSRVAKEEKEVKENAQAQSASVEATQQPAIEGQTDSNNIELTQVDPQAATSTIEHVSAHVETADQVSGSTANLSQAGNIFVQNEETSVEHQTSPDTQTDAASAVTQRAKSNTEAGDAPRDLSTPKDSESIPPLSVPESPSYPPSAASYPPVSSISSSVATIQPNDVSVATTSTSSEDAEDMDAFLLSATTEELKKVKQSTKKEEDVGSDWSEVEA
ncbi:hypothetical protein VNI00_014320 [Paramarasmius palmivorus]|uniref:BAG domain-containing protein n=1 Tax=Paramarasmius palmivorus TaxID=297713 RepID=A0AAW0BS57_9AGAR